jgi:hypothetical protein
MSRPSRSSKKSRSSSICPETGESLVAPESSSYVSEKAAYDPDGAFFAHLGVGSEDWSADGFTKVAKR